VTSLSLRYYFVLSCAGYAGTQLTVAVPLRAQATDSARFAPTSAVRATSAHNVIIDLRGNAGVIVEGRRRFGRSSTARIYFVNKNPFRYSYDIKVSEVGVPSQDFDAVKVFIQAAGLSNKVLNAITGVQHAEDAAVGADTAATDNPPARKAQLRLRTF
jgi:hypothetical protein